MLRVSSVESSSTWISSRSRGYSIRHTASMRRSATYISLYSGSWIVTTGVGSSGGRRGRTLVPVLHVEIDQVVPVPAVNREDNQDEKICGERQGFSRRHVLEAQSLILLSGL